MQRFLPYIILAALGTSNAPARQLTIIEDFEGYHTDSLPHLWKMPDKNSKIMRPLPPNHAKPNDFVNVTMGENGKILRAYTQGESVQIALPQGDGLDWDLDLYPRLRWRWRAEQLPDGGRETSRKLNDTGAAMYVAFACGDWLRRPCTIKYTYSSTLPKNAQTRYGKLFVLVVSSALDEEEDWIHVERNVRHDYEMFFGEQPKGDPIYIMIWNDSDNTDSEADVYFDDIVAITEE